MAQAVVTDTKDPNWGLAPVVRITDPNWGAAPSPAPKPGSKASIVGLATSKSAAPIANAAANFAKNPNVPKHAAKIGRVLGGVAPVIAGGMKMGPAGAAIGMAGSAQGAWAGGKTGWFTGKLAQQLMTPVAKVLEAVKPYAQTISTLSGAQALLDLAQMAEPNRTDIGVLGVGKTQDPAARDKFAADWDAWMSNYPKAVGKAKWTALNPTERLTGFKAFMAKQTEGGQ